MDTLNTQCLWVHQSYCFVDMETTVSNQKVRFSSPHTHTREGPGSEVMGYIRRLSLMNSAPFVPQHYIHVRVTLPTQASNSAHLRALAAIRNVLYIQIYMCVCVCVPRCVCVCVCACVRVCVCVRARIAAEVGTDDCRRHALHIVSEIRNPNPEFQNPNPSCL